jgi:hypothetical protein
MSLNKLGQFQQLVQQLADQYDVVNQAVDTVYAQRESASKTEMLESITQLLTRVKQTEAEIQPLRESLQADNVTIPATTQAIINQTIQTVTTLIPRIGALEKEAVESREKLAPVIREGVRAAKMQSAYAKQRS